jgi:hypothetical protein
VDLARLAINRFDEDCLWGTAELADNDVDGLPSRHLMRLTYLRLGDLHPKVKVNGMVMTRGFRLVPWSEVSNHFTLVAEDPSESSEGST